MEQEIIQGTIEAVVFHNYDNGYCVLRLKCQDGQTVTVVGTIPLPSVGEQLLVTGKWTSHPSYGKQFDAEFLERLMPGSATEILQYLSGRVIKGIGPKLAGRIVARFGDETLRIMEQEPRRLAEVSGISLAKAIGIGEEFRLQVGMRHLMEFFALHHLPAELAVKAYKLYGENTIDMLYDDPYLLMDQELDAPFGAVDQFAVELGVAADDPRRVEAGILFELRYNLSAGHSFLPEAKLIGATALLLSIDEATIQQGLTRLLEAQRLSRDVLAGIRILYLPELYQAECFCTHMLQDLARCHYPAPPHISKLLKKAQQVSGIVYSQQQLSAIAEAVSCGLLLITGGPGTGKSATRFCVK